MLSSSNILQISADIASGLKQLRREAVVVDWCRFAVFSSCGINIAVTSQLRRKVMSPQPLAHLSPDYLFCPCRMTLRAWNLPSDAWHFWKVSEHRSYLSICSRSRLSCCLFLRLVRRLSRCGSQQGTFVGVILRPRSRATLLIMPLVSIGWALENYHSFSRNT